MATVPVDTSAGQLRSLLEVALQREERHLLRISQLERDNRLLAEAAERSRKGRGTFQRQVQEQTRQLEALTKQVETLTARVMVTSKSSSTSSQPPSGDPVETRNQRRYPARERTTRRPGGQEGHPGAALGWDVPDEAPPTAQHSATRGMTSQRLQW